MSVYKSKRGESSVQFIETARQLEAHTFACCMKAPKRYERFLTGRIMELSSEGYGRYMDDGYLIHESRDYL